VVSLLVASSWIDKDYQIADESRKVATLYDMLDALDATNVDAKGLPFTVRLMLPRCRCSRAHVRRRSARCS
jgi:hypothetical protein